MRLWDGFDGFDGRDVQSIDPQRVLLIGSERLRTAPLEVIIEVQNFLELPQDVSWLSVDSLDTARLIDETFPSKHLSSLSCSS